MNEKGKELNNAILNKVASILGNMDMPDRATIKIDVARGELPEIEYCIKEFILVDKGEEHERQF